MPLNDPPPMKILCVRHWISVGYAQQPTIELIVLVSGCVQEITFRVEIRSTEYIAMIIMCP